MLKKRGFLVLAVILLVIIGAVKLGTTEPIPRPKEQRAIENLPLPEERRNENSDLDSETSDKNIQDSNIQTPPVKSNDIEELQKEIENAKKEMDTFLEKNKNLEREIKARKDNLERISGKIQEAETQKQEIPKEKEIIREIYYQEPQSSSFMSILMLIVISVNTVVIFFLFKQNSSSFPQPKKYLDFTR